MATGIMVAIPRAPSTQLHPCARVGNRVCSSIRVSHCSWGEGIRRIRPVAVSRRASSDDGRPPALHEEGEADAAAAAAAPRKKKKLRLKKTYSILASRFAERPPNYLLWASGVIFALVMRKVIRHEVRRWPGFFLELYKFLKALTMLLSKLLLEYAKEPSAWTVGLLSWAALLLLDLYTFVVEAAPVQSLLTTVTLSTAVMSVGEAARINSAASQPWVLFLAATAGVCAFSGVINFTTLSALLGVLSVVSYVRNRDVVTAVLPAAATLVAVGVPAVQATSFGCFLLLALYRNWSAPESRDKVAAVKWNSPPIFVVFVLAIGLNVAVNWLRARHSVWLAT